MVHSADRSNASVDRHRNVVKLQSVGFAYCVGRIDHDLDRLLGLLGSHILTEFREHPKRKATASKSGGSNSCKRGKAAKTSPPSPWRQSSIILQPRVD